MIKTYDCTMFISKEELPKRKVRLYVTEGLKWEDDNETELVYTGLVRWHLVNNEDATEIENNLSDDAKDEYHEYLVLDFNDGTSKIFGNSHVSMFLR